VHPAAKEVQVRECIKSGEITSRLPSITHLTTQSGLAVGTVRRAIDILVDEGLVQTVPGRGTFVMR
jgi:DNA-binding GntR family transcriptional regulator